MRSEELPWWLQDIQIIGFEDEEDDDGGDPEDDEEEDDSETEEDDSEDQEDDDEEESDRNNDALKKALRTERMERKKLQRELKALRAQIKPPKKDEEEESESKPDERSERLARRLRDNSVETMILKHAGSDFRDTDAVLALIDMDLIDVDQDDDDPSEIEVDEDSVKDAIKDLRKRHSYLLKPAEERSRSGSKFNGRSKKSDTLTDDALREKYAGLRR